MKVFKQLVPKDLISPTLSYGIYFRYFHELMCLKLRSTVCKSTLFPELENALPAFGSSCIIIESKL